MHRGFGNRGRGNLRGQPRLWRPDPVFTPDRQAGMKNNGKARSRLQAKIQEGLDALDRGDVVDGEEFFTRWKTRLEAVAGSTASASSPVKRRA